MDYDQGGFTWEKGEDILGFARHSKCHCKKGRMIKSSFGGQESGSEKASARNMLNRALPQ